VYFSCILGDFGLGCKVEGAGGNSRLDVPDYSSIHGLVNRIIALIVGVVEEDSGMRKIAGEESCAGEGARCPEAVRLSDLKTSNMVLGDAYLF
jgi:hypothetical protein